MCHKNRHINIYNQERTIKIKMKYLNIPVKQGIHPQLLSISQGGKLVREFAVELAEAEPDYWMFLDVSGWYGKKVTLKIDTLPKGSQGLKSIFQDNTVRGFDSLYHEKYRPRFHFSSRRGWHNDPNGLVFYNGKYHLFYQHNPLGWDWGNMTWGHALSSDLVHWKEIDPALYPDSMGTMFSGSAVVDWNNTSGFQQGKEKTLVAFYTAAGGTSDWSKNKPFVQCMAYSINKGLNWIKYLKNPVLQHIVAGNRDPKVVWYESGNLWVMALYFDKNEYALFTSKDLKSWKEIQRINIENAAECPDFFEIALDNNSSQKKWVLTGANGRFLAGRFDGNQFFPETESCPSEWGRNYYAVQSYSDTRDGRRIQIGWMAGTEFRGMPFNQQMSFPRELTLRSTKEGIRLFALPVREIETLHGESKSWTHAVINPGDNLLNDLHGKLYHLVAEFTIDKKTASEFGFDLRGFEILYNTKASMIKAHLPNDPSVSEAKVLPGNNRIRMEILLDITSVEIFINNGEIPMAFFYIPADYTQPISLFSKGGNVLLNDLIVYELKSAWL
jgi:fructan beta-fructosidase